MTAPERAQYTICDACGNVDLEHDKAAWTADGASYCPRCLPSASPEVAALIAEARREDAKLLLDAYKGMLVLRRILDKAGLVAGASAADQIAKRIVDAHPEFPGLTSLRALKETTHD